MKKYLITLVCVAGATALFTACTSESGGPSTSISYEQVKAAEQVPVSFDTYLGEQAITRANIDAATGAATNANLATNGFGVFAYYTGATAYDAGQTAYEPNFMYNEKVSNSGSGWTYSPVKYWPNDNATADDEGATGTTSSKVSFFAYAPWVGDQTNKNILTTSKTKGITALTSNSYTKDPLVTFVKASDDNVDLLWGTAGSNSYVTVTGTSNNTAALTGGLDGYKVNANLNKQKIDGKVNFAFKHALAKIGSIYVVSDIALEDGSADSGGSKANTTKITITSITITSAAHNLGGTLNLATGQWSTTTPNGTLTYSIGTGDMIDNFKEPASISDWSDIPTGVTTTPTELLNSTALANKLFTFLPTTQPDLTIRIIYQVRTEDPALSLGYSDVTQNISKTINLNQAFALNKNYRLTLHLGLTSVKFTASVADWENAGNTDFVNLPINVD